MAALLHDQRWPELSGEFAARELLAQAITHLEKAPGDTAARARLSAQAALSALHQVVHNVEAQAEHVARVAGTFTQSASTAVKAADAGLQQANRMIAELEARLKALEPKPSTPPA